jgi:hypothetical protein
MTQCIKCKQTISPANQAHYGLHPECFKKWFNVSQLADFTGLQRKNSTSADRADEFSKQNTSFFHGKFKKYSANLLGNSYILKMREKDAPELPEVEYLCNLIGQELNIPVAEFYFIDFNGDKTFVTRNFIKIGSPTDLQHIYHFRPDENHSCAGLIEAITIKTGQPRDLRIFIQTLLFDALIGNHDRHGRNLAFITTASSSRLSPIYDNVSYLSLESGLMLKADFNPTGKIHTSETYEPSIKDYVRELKRLGFNEDIQLFLKQIHWDRIHLIIDESYCSDLMKTAIKTLVTKRFEELKNEQ